MAASQFKNEVYAFIDNLSREQLQEIARLAMDLAWPAYFQIAGSNDPPRPLDVTERSRLQSALVIFSGGTVLDFDATARQHRPS